MNLVDIKEANTATDGGFKRAMKTRMLGLPQVTLRDPDRPDAEEPYVEGIQGSKDELLRVIHEASRKYIQIPSP